jgi:sugar diacid utilization regulator
MSASSGTGLSAVASLAAAITEGRGLPGLARAASEVLGLPIALLDRSGLVLATAGATRDEEARLAEGGRGVETADLAIGEHQVGQLRWVGGEGPDPEVIGVLAALSALEVERARSESWGNEEQAALLVGGLLDDGFDPDTLVPEAAELGCDLSGGAGFLMVRAHAGSAQAGDWRSRVLDLTLRTVRAVVPGSLACLEDGEESATVGLLVPAAEDERLLRAQEALDRDLPRSLGGIVVTIARSRVCRVASELGRTAAEARLALNVGDAEGRSPIAFEETGAYRLLLGTGEAELRRFFSETVEPLVEYDDQYDTDLVATVETYLESDANVPATAKRMFTHRHTIRYRLERIRELSGHDATATEGRERLGLGIKAMRVLGIAAPRGPAREKEKPGSG